MFREVSHITEHRLPYKLGGFQIYSIACGIKQILLFMFCLFPQIFVFLITVI